MADLTPEEAAQLGYGPNFASDARSEMERDPLAAWWAMLTGDKKTALGNMASNQGGGFDPARSGNEAAALANSFNLARDVRNAPEMDAIFRAGATAPGRANPYSTVIADQSRPAQLALMAQMRQQMNGPSIAGMQGQRAFGASGQQALMQGGRAGMLGAQNAGAGIAGDLGQARLAEIMRAQAGLGASAGALRGADLTSANNQMQAGLAQQRQDDLLRQFYASQGANLANAREQAGANREITRLQSIARANARDAGAAQNFAGQAANVWGGAATGGVGVGSSGGGGPTHGGSGGSH
jgi:hypothetical protein